MSKKEPYLFITYSQSDTKIVKTLTAELQNRGVKIWLDMQNIKPGERWDESIEKAIINAAGMLVFVSKASVKSNNVMDEVTFMMENNSLVIPVLIEKDVDLPFRLRKLEYIDLTDINKNADRNIKLDYYADKIIQRIQSFNPSADSLKLDIPKEDISRIASSMAEEKRTPATSSESGRLDSIFIVHGRNATILDEVESYIASIGIKPIVLTKIEGAEKSLFDKFLTWSRDIKYAIVLISADDLGASREQYEIPEVANHALQFRARQNVILELGFFYGYLGWERVFVMFKAPDKLFPNFEYPSDLLGVVFDSIDKEGKWKNTIEKRLKEAGFIIKK